MSQMERIYKLDRLFRRKKPPSRREILDMFEISPAQFKRDLEYMRNRLGAPVTFDMEAGGYKYTSEEFNLPGLWFTRLLLGVFGTSISPRQWRCAISIVPFSRSRRLIIRS